MPTGHTTAAQQEKVVDQQPPSKRVREQRSDDGPAILPGMEHFVDLLRKVKRPALVVRLLERASGDALPELQALADAAKGKLPVESRQAFFHCVAKLDAAIRQRLENVVERVILLGDDYGAQAVQSVLDERREDDTAVLEAPSDRHSRALHLCILQEFPEPGVRREARFDQAEHEQVMHRQWKSDHFSSHYLGPKDVEPKNDGDVQETLRTRIAELFPHVPKDQILIEQFVRHGLSQALRDEDDDAEGESLTLLHTVCATFNGSAEQSGVSGESFEKGLRKLSTTMLEAATGSEDAARGFSAVGVEFKNQDSTLRATDQVLLDLAERFKAMPDGAEKTALAVQLFGKSGAELIPFLNQGRDGINELAAEMQALGVQMSSETAAQAGNFNDALDKLKLATTSIGNQIIASLLPALNDMAGGMVESAKQGGTLRAILDGLALVLKTLALGAATVGKAFVALGEAIGAGVAAAVEALKGNTDGAKATGHRP
ncbi:MAG: hypothetical protein U5M72_12560 [Pseudomonas sp.]|nr:hypothetical protein [Pseudomonas sp.]